MQDAGYCGWDVGCWDAVAGMQDVGCGMLWLGCCGWDVGCATHICFYDFLLELQGVCKNNKMPMT